jgi:hypothetical protein
VRYIIGLKEKEMGVYIGTIWLCLLSKGGVTVYGLMMGCCVRVREIGRGRWNAQVQNLE